MKMEKQFVLSPFTFVKEKKEKILLYHSLFMFKLIGSSDLKNIIRAYKEKRNISFSNKNYIKLDNLLKQYRFVIRKSEDKLDLHEFRKRFIPEFPKIKLMYLFATNKCNLKCKYCCVDKSENKNFKEKNTSKKTAKKALDLFFEITPYSEKSDRSERGLIIFGGEPLINWKTTKYIIRYARIKEKNTKKALDIILVTNGTLMNETIAKFLVDNEVKTGFSIDGTKKEHDKFRVYRKNGKGTWQDSINGLKAYQRLDSKGVISCTIASHNANSLNRISNYFIKNLNQKSIGFTMITGSKKNSETYIAPRKIASSMFSVGKKIFLARKIYEEKFYRKLKAFIFQVPYIHECGACGQQISVDQDGRIGICNPFMKENKYILGSVFDRDIKKKIIKSKYLKKWIKHTPFFNKKCKNCIGISICGGGCAYETYFQNKKFYGIDKRFCEYCKLVIEFLLTKLLENKDTLNLSLSQRDGNKSYAEENN